jgi:hypothetical protein
MANRANLIATYNANPTLQSRYTLQQYLDLFGFGATTTTTPTTTTTTPTQTPATPGIPNIINQNLGGGDGSDGGPQGIATPSTTYERTYAPDLNFAEFTSGVTGTPSFTQEYTERKDPIEGLMELYQKYSPVGMIGKAIQDRKDFKQAQTDKALEQIAMQEKIRQAEAEAAAARLANPVTYQYNNPSAKAPQDGVVQRDAPAFTGGGANVAAANYTSTGREGFGYGLADGGRVGLENGGTLSESDFPFLINRPGENMGRKKPGLSDYDKDTQDYDYFDDEPIITIPMGGKLKKPKKKKKKEKKFADGGRVYLYNRLK